MEALLGYEMVQVACGASHVLALSTERELFAWGRGDGGKHSACIPASVHPLGSLCASSHNMLLSVSFGLEVTLVLFRDYS